MRPTPSSRNRRGQSLVFALALVLVLTMVVAATQMQTVHHLRVSRVERDYERALSMAEAGANAYLNEMSNGFSTAVAWMPAVNPLSSSTPMTLQEFKTAARDGTIPANMLRYYPAGQTTQGFYVGHTGNAAALNIFSYGWSNGVVRRIRVGASSFSVFDWAAVYALDPNTGTGSGDNGPAWRFTGSANVVGASGAEGVIVGNNNVTFYDGPVILAGTGDSLNPSSNFTPPVLQSQPNVPNGHTGTGTVANPPIRRLSRSLNLETADQAANDWAQQAFGVTTSAGVAYFKANNDNNTGIRLLVRDLTTSRVRELAAPYAIDTTGAKAYALTWPQPSDYTSRGKTANEVAVGLRVYPGNYYFEQISQSTSDTIYLRTYADGNTPASPPIQVYASDGVTLDPANPNSGMAGEKNIRFWIGNPATGSAPNSSISERSFMEDPTFASRFRIYSATRGTIQVSGTNANPPPKFRVNMLAYNYYMQGSNRVYYGDVSIASGTYLFGSLIGWQVTVSGGCTVEKQASEGGTTSDRLTYLVNSWTEML